jgi:DNA-binding FadR family transcriptional regulator
VESSLKCAARIARNLEEQFIIEGWPLGRIYGSEIELARRYGVGRAIVRETARILEARGITRTRRGRHGGLELLAPSSARFNDMLGGYCFLINVTRRDVHLARLTIDRVAARMAAERTAKLEFIKFADHAVLYEPTMGKELRRTLIDASANRVLTIFSDCVDSLQDMELPRTLDPEFEWRRTGSLVKFIDRMIRAIGRGDSNAAGAWAAACSRRITQALDGERAAISSAPDALHRPGALAADVFHRRRADQIVHSLIRRGGPGQWVNGKTLGNELELCDLYRVDRGVLRQAIRILEAAEIAVALPGRGRGLVARAPGPASISRLICCHFAANRVGHNQAMQVFECLGVEMMALAARRESSAHRAAADAAVAALSRRCDRVFISDLIDTEEKQFALAGNPLLELFWRSARAFPSWAMLGNLPVPSGVVREFVENSYEVAAAVTARNPNAAARAQRKKLSRLRCSIEEILPPLPIIQ